MDNKAHRSLTEAYTTMITEESATTKGQMLSCASELEDMLEGNEKTKDLARKAESLGRAIRKAFKEPKADEGDKPAKSDAKDEVEEGYQKDAEGDDNHPAKKDAKTNG